MYMSGWDWGPRLPDMGIFRPVEIAAYDTDAIEDVHVLQNHGEKGVELEIAVTTKKAAWAELYAEMDGKGRLIARAVEIDFMNLDCRLLENFFDITDSEPRSVFAKTSDTAENLEQNLIIRSVYDIA